MHILKMFHEDIPTVTELWGEKVKNLIKYTKMGEQPFLQATYHLYLKHIPIKCHEDIPNNYRILG